MKAAKTIAIFLLYACSASADEAARRKSAEAILEVTNAAGAMKSGFLATIEPIVANMRKQGMPTAAATEMTAAINTWFDTEVRWADIKPRMVDLYLQEFTEQELKELLAFYQTPVGRKAIVKIPVVMRQGAAIGQELASKKQDSLKRSIQTIVDKYRPQTKP